MLSSYAAPPRFWKRCTSMTDALQFPQISFPHMIAILVSSFELRIEFMVESVKEGRVLQF